MTLVADCLTNGDVKTKLTASLWTRVTKETKRAYEQLAKRRGIKEAQLQREALQIFVVSELSKKEVA